MKTYISKIIIALFLNFFFLNLYSQTKYTKTIKKNYALTEKSSFELINKFGNVTVETSNSDILDILVTITVNTKNQEKADDFFEDTEINFKKTGDLISAETVPDEKIHVKNFSIDYTIKMPENLRIKMYNKFGNIFINKLKSQSVIECKYGNLKINELTTSELSKPATINLKYSKGNIAKCDYANINVKYSDLTIDESRVLDINSGYSKLILGKAYIIKAESKYDPVFHIDEIAKCEIEGKYSDYNIGKVHNILSAKLKYSNIKIKNTDKDFSKIFIVSQYGNIKIKTDDNASYKLNAEAEYGNITSEIEKNSENYGTDVSCNGFVGNNKQSKSVITISSKYGNIIVH